MKRFFGILTTIDGWSRATKTVQGLDTIKELIKTEMTKDRTLAHYEIVELKEEIA